VKTFARLILLAILIVAAWFLWAFTLPVKPSSPTIVTLHSGASARQIAATLDSSGVIRSKTAFVLYHLYIGRRTLKAGDYLFENSATMAEVHERIARGDVYTVAVVIPEGFNIYDIAVALEQAKLCSREDFLKAARSETALIADLSPDAPSLEGFLYPDTYDFGPSMSPHDMAAMMVKRFRKEATTLGLHGDIARTVTMASIVEKETRVETERPLVASVFENRIVKKMPLSTDPTVIYAALLDGEWSGVIHQSDLQRESPYNTYRHNGLPPGPIANPGHTALLAAMEPAHTQYLYFVADNTGGHNFARTADEHAKNVAAYRKGVAKHVEH